MSTHSEAELLLYLKPPAIQLLPLLPLLPLRPLLADEQTSFPEGGIGRRRNGRRKAKERLERGHVPQGISAWHSRGSRK